MPIPKKTPEEILEVVNRCRDATQARRDLMDSDLALYFLKEYQVAKDAGDYESMTANDAYSQAAKLIEMLSTSTIKFKCPLINTTKKEKDRGATTERLIYGLKGMADEWRAGFQLQNVQTAMAFNAVVFGYIVQRYMLWQDHENKDKIVSDYAVWPAPQAFWGNGKNGLAWACLENWKTVEDISDTYGINEDHLVTEGNENKVLIYDYYDNENETICTADRIFKTPQPHGRTYPPVYIQPVGASP